jgi:transglutaminase-like putative cysteine protease
MTRFRILLWLIVIALTRPAFGGNDYRLGAPPRWVDVLQIPSAGVSDARKERADLQELLHDRQERVRGARVESYRHFAFRVTSAAGVESQSELSFEFDPSYETLTIHRIVIHRGAERIDALRTASLERLNVESDLERRIYDRRATIHAILSDVRIGDTVEYAYSIEGSHPALAGRYATFARFAEDVPIRRVRFRVLWPKSRKLYIGRQRTNAQPRVEEVGDDRIYTWDFEETRAIDEEDKLPDWYDPYPTVELSEFGSWNDVASWASLLYEPHARQGQEVERHVAEWSKLPRSEARLGAALRFVQDEVRYLGVEVGAHSLEPNDAELILSRRFGDCKDKSILLVTLLKRLGIEADPALVHTAHRRFVKEFEPSPYAFDHVIVRVRLGGRDYWFDPTASFQRGPAEHLLPPLYGSALVVRADTRQLSDIPAPRYEKPTIIVHERFRVGAEAEPVRLTVSSLFRDDEAEIARSDYASDVIAARERHYLNFYAREFPTIELSSPMSTKNDETNNELRVEEAYTIREFWRDAERDLYAWAIGERLTKPDVAKREMPLAVTHPVFVRQVIDVDLPESYELMPIDTTLRGKALEFRAKSSSTPTKFVVTYELRTLSDHVPAADVAGHLELLDRIEDELTYQLTRGSKRESEPAELRTAWMLPASIGALALMLGVALRLLRTSRARERGDHPELAEGANARAPVLVETAASIARYADGLRCTCADRAKLAASEEPKEVRYLGRTLLVASLICPSCSMRRARYFLVLGAH